MHDDFDQEVMPGLPERPPQGEEILWQGRPATWALAKASLSLFWVAGYFALLTLWRFVVVVDSLPMDLAIAATVPVAVLGVITCALLLYMSVREADSCPASAPAPSDDPARSSGPRSAAPPSRASAGPATAISTRPAAFHSGARRVIPDRAPPAVGPLLSLLADAKAAP